MLWRVHYKYTKVTYTVHVIRELTTKIWSVSQKAKRKGFAELVAFQTDNDLGHV